MTESKIDLTDRLRREGRWEEASRFRDDERVRLKVDEGLSRTAANQLAWEAVAAKFPPLPEAEQADVLLPMPPEVAARESDGTIAQFICDASWVYHHLNATEEEAAAAPSAGAWGLWAWARQDQTRFLAGIFPKALQMQIASREVQPQSEVFEGDLQRAREIMQEVKRMDAAGAWDE